VKEPTSLP
jgi:acetate kinase